MSADLVERLFERYYSGEKLRRGLFDAIASWRPPARVLYPGGFIHVAASFVFPSVTYVDNDRNAKRFFARMDDVQRLVSRHKDYEGSPHIVFHGSSYESPLAEEDESFDLLISLYAGFISKPCKRYLRRGGVLAVNNSHADAGLASIDPEYEFIGVVRGRGDSLRVDETELDTYFRPKKAQVVTEALLRERGRGIAYTRTAPVYLFQRVV